MKIDRALQLNPNAQLNVDERRQAQEGQLRDASKMYEQHFMREMVKVMRQSIPEGELIKTSFGEKIFREQLDNEYVQKWSERGGVGLADMIFNHIKERYMPGPEQQWSKPQGPLPLDAVKPKWDVKTEVDENKTGYLFRAKESLNSNDREVKAPWGGQVQNSYRDENGVTVVTLRHDQGPVSRLSFSGVAPGLKAGDIVSSGRTIGQIQGAAPWLHWKIEANRELDPTT
jgi:peptidoglycan hydrolase FlgJ